MVVVFDRVAVRLGLYGHASLSGYILQLTFVHKNFCLSLDGKLNFNMSVQECNEKSRAQEVVKVKSELF